eukprot:1160561-Pelagomonas_calceolata.AAC.4
MHAGGSPESIACTLEAGRTQDCIVQPAKLSRSLTVPQMLAHSRALASRWCGTSARTNKTLPASCAP